MLLAGLGITMGTANVLQSAAIARANISSEPFVIETAKSQPRPSTLARDTAAKNATAKDTMVREQRVTTGRSRETHVRTASLAGL